MVREASRLILAMEVAIRKEWFLLRGTDKSPARDTQAREGKGVAAVLHRGSTFGGEKFESGPVDKSEVGGVWGGECNCRL